MSSATAVAAAPSGSAPPSRKSGPVRDAYVFLVDWRLCMLQPLPSAVPSPAADPDASAPDEDEPPSPPTPTLLSLTLRCLADVLKAKILTRAPDLVSVIAFGAAGPPTRPSWPGVRVLHPLALSSAATIKNLQSLARRLDENDDPAAAATDAQRDLAVGPDASVAFDKALWAARHQFSVSAAARNVLQRRRLLVLTADPDPTRGVAAVRALARTQARDLGEMGAALDVMLLTPSPSPLHGPTVGAAAAAEQASPFFASLVYADMDEAAPTTSTATTTTGDRGSLSLTPATSLPALVACVRRAHASRRALRRTTLRLAPGYVLGVALFALVRRAVRPQKVELAAATNTPVFKITTTTCGDVGEVLKPPGVRYTFVPEYLKKAEKEAERAAFLVESGDDVVEGEGEDADADENADAGAGNGAGAGADADEVATAPEKASKPGAKLLFAFTKEEAAKAKALGEQGLVLYGFRKRSFVREELTMSGATFVYPDESALSGSTTAFAVLLNAMLSQRVVAIVSVRLSKTGGKGMRFAMLVPQREVTGEDGQQVLPGGMQMHYLPYKDDVYTEWRAELKTENEEEEENGDVEEDAGGEGTDVVQEATEEEDVLDENGELERESDEVRTARELVTKLRVRDYDDQTFANPDLERFYAGLSRAAGVESEFKPQDGLLDADHETMRRRGGKLLESFKRATCGESFDGEETARKFGTMGARRAAAALAKNAERERERELLRAAAERECDFDLFEERFRDGKLETLRVKELTMYCRARGLSGRGNKRNMVIEVEDDMRKRMRTTEP